jgi:hypothetical protein
MLRKARVQGTRFCPLLERQTSPLKNNNIAKAFNQQSYILTFTQINLISTETCSEPLLKTSPLRVQVQHDNRGHPQRGQFMLRKARAQGTRFCPLLERQT